MEGKNLSSHLVLQKDLVFGFVLAAITQQSRCQPLVRTVEIVCLAVEASWQVPG